MRDERRGDAWVWATHEPGTYLLLLQVPEQTVCQIGRLGRIVVQPGWYVYVGSALGGLGARLRRHARTPKPYHWHVDALRDVARLVRIAVHVGRERLECATATRVARLPGAACPIPRFGASDCRCVSHLFLFADEPNVQLDPSWLVVAVDTPSDSAAMTCPSSLASDRCRAHAARSSASNLSTSALDRLRRPVG